MPLPTRDKLISRIPEKHPRIFVRPEQIKNFRNLAKGRLRAQFKDMVRECEKLLKNPPTTYEPPKYPENLKRKSNEWNKIWWGNRVYVIRALNSAALLAKRISP